MRIIVFNPKVDVEQEVKLSKAYIQFEKLLLELRKRDLPDDLVISINNIVAELNSTTSSAELLKAVDKMQKRIIKFVEQEVKLVPKHYYRNLWLALGMAVFGIPIGVVFGSIFGDMAFLGVGLPIGILVGLSIGYNIDKKAHEEGRQLDIEI